MTSIYFYVEERVDVIAVGWRYYPNTSQWEMVEQVSEQRAVTCVEVDEVPENVKKAISVLLEEGN